MPNLNKVMLMGNLTRDPELRYTSNNLPVVRFGLAVNRRWKSQQGEQQEETMFIDCAAFSRTAEVINQYFHKGKPIFIEGRIRLDRWQDKEGNNRSKHEIIIDQFQFLESKSDSERGGRGGRTPDPGGGPGLARADGCHGSGGWGRIHTGDEATGQGRW